MDHSVESYIKRLPVTTLLSLLSQRNYEIFHELIITELQDRDVPAEIILNAIRKTNG